MYTSPLPRNLDTIEETLLGVHAALEGLVRFGLRCCDEPAETIVYEIACLLRPQAAAVGACVCDAWAICGSWGQNSPTTTLVSFPAAGTQVEGSA